jgi:sulfur-carrier protein
MRVRIPTVLQAYTHAREVEVTGATLGQVVHELDRRFPGLAFRVVDEQGRIRPHMRFFVNGELSADLAAPVRPADEVQIVQALSGG